jgi:hypothetical protein
MQHNRSTQDLVGMILVSTGSMKMDNICAYDIQIL